jgi:CRP-like cAMP-binding protein
MNAYDLLKSSELFSGLSHEHIESIAQITCPQNFETGEMVVLEHDDPDYCYLIRSGRVQIFRHADGNNRIILGEIGPGGILGELSIIDHCPRSASAVTLSPTKTLTISKEDFRALLHTYPEICLELLPIVIKRLRKAHDDLYLMSFLST